MSEQTAAKVTSAHLARTAYLYVRQSTQRQVLTNTESAARQYTLRQKAITLGWEAERIVTIDTDQGQSGASAADREGFQRLVAEVSMGRAGIVLGLEVSRLARNNADWHRLLEICAMSSTLICDEDGLYDSTDFNDRLLLGLKGTMSEAELHFIRARLIGGQLSKARRGELQMGLPVGLIYDPTGKVMLDPDTGVQQAIRHLFALFARTGSARATVQQFNADKLLFPVRVRTGAHKGELAWMPLQHWRVLRTLHNPRYAGAFAYGRRRERLTGTGKKSYQLVPREQWIALIHDAHPGYINWDTYESNQKLLLGNATAYGEDRAPGPAREGTALLQGLAICGRCGRRMTVRYHTRRGVEVPDYQCMNRCIQDGGQRCQTIPGGTVDDAVANLLLGTLTPHALEVALTVQAELDTRAAEADALRRGHVERARHRADLARRRYLAVDPDNRLVADSLEADWNDALRALQTAREDYDRASAAGTATLTDELKNRIHSLATDFPALWSNPNTAQRDRKRMVRLLVDDVTLHKTDRIHLHVRFRGGQTHSLVVAIPPTSWQARQTHKDTVAELDRLLDTHTDAQTADALNAAGHRSGENKPFTASIVVHVRRKYHLPSHADRLRAQGLLTTTELAQRLGVHPSTVKSWTKAGILNSHKANDKNERLYEPAITGDPRLTVRQGSPLRKRVLT
ncbi:recombinase family protein [Mycolicibacterium novocastrense]|uniref:Recombinase family protein n=1 Tax=Mycolicibacterium novocastrense TaxID=59813 RepID=A0AAW5STB0_MYCNV|nr:recombinase family protein [Mycolicibacterium novocastrense]MCV7027509.1 recombinase family protein [Mycolicibacterium novocastrense]GAT11295.1 transposase [Mycolicibacterium novocastrense]